jgi:hypothetical protein
MRKRSIDHAQPELLQARRLIVAPGLTLAEATVVFLQLTRWSLAFGLDEANTGYWTGSAWRTVACHGLPIRVGIN